MKRGHSSQMLINNIVLNFLVIVPIVYLGNREACKTVGTSHRIGKLQCGFRIIGVVVPIGVDIFLMENEVSPVITQVSKSICLEDLARRPFTIVFRSTVG